MKRGFKIYLFRHGQTTYNRDKRFTGWHDPELTRKGRMHARMLARKLKNKKFQIAIQTRFERSKDTLKEVLKFHPECEKTITDNRMIERKYGNLSGTLHKTFINRVGKRLLKLDVEGDVLEKLPLRERVKLRKFLGKKEYDLIHRGYKIPPPKGESLAMVEKRVKSFIRDLKKMMKKKKVNVAISGHGNSMRMFRKIMEKASVKETVSWFIPYDKVFEYTVR
ncbi:MAG: phosphoglycerate mutase family protein [Nanoarchaeota archaeon]